MNLICLSVSFCVLGKLLTGAIVECRVRNSLPPSSGEVLQMQLHMLLVTFARRACCVLIVQCGSTQVLRVYL